MIPQFSKRFLILSFATFFPVISFSQVPYSLKPISDGSTHIVTTKISLNSSEINTKLYVEDSVRGGESSIDERNYVYLKNLDSFGTVGIKQSGPSENKFLESMYFAENYGLGSGYGLFDTYADHGVISNKGGKGLILRSSTQYSVGHTGITFLTGPNYYGALVPERMRISESGFVGINTTNPVDRLQVNGNIRVENGDLILTEAVSGIIMKSAGGNCFKTIINDSGQFSSSPVPCP
ncbi:hypothetical protein [Jiulongibacter sediminis]|uniref:Uncharacterized protein n=1 Tax=Jiulongibacter sediminis TaxID=1605367 RepID=A0A0P7C677_9BACT|nr:hypothetical protein [Jiulongibacter sediminis]KPM49803.1 hypothetical protein AFM12_04310 [Jiulongibacter sediminis]TBX26840.1 hypothetical protein TK44_04315 [Jiulongibacter sediminis]